MSSRLIVNSIRHTGASGDAVSLANDGTCTANITNNLSNRRLTINGAMTIAQRGVSSTSSGYGTVDRFSMNYHGTDEAPTQSQADVAAGTTPYTNGFRKSFKITNGNQTSGAGGDDRVTMIHILEAQDLANSGWNYKSSSSNVILSFWCKSSVAQNFFGFLRSNDVSTRSFAFQTGSLTADTWTKVTVPIPGNTNVSFDNDNGAGLQIEWTMFRGVNTTGTGGTLNTWVSYNSSEREPDNTSTWYTTNDATFELTGVQLEVGDHATDFEHRRIGDELKSCERYYQILAKGPGKYWGGTACNYTATQLYMPIQFKTQMRSTPSLVFTTGSSYYQIYDAGNTAGINITRPESLVYHNELGGSLYVGASYVSGLSAGYASLWYTYSSNALIAVEAEL